MDDTKNMESIISQANQSEGVRELSHVLQALINSKAGSSANLHGVYTMLTQALGEAAVQFRQSGNDISPSYDFFQLNVPSMLIQLMTNFSQVYSQENKVSSAAILLMSNVFNAVAQISKVGEEQRKSMVEMDILASITKTMFVVLDQVDKNKKSIDKIDKLIFWLCDCLFFLCVRGKDISYLLNAGGVELMDRLSTLVEKNNQNETHIMVLKRMLLVGAHNIEHKKRQNSARSLHGYQMQLQISETPDF